MLGMIFQLGTFFIRKMKEVFYILGMRLLYMRFYLKSRFLESDPIFSVEIKSIHNMRRTEGISGLYRVKNEAALLEASVRAHLPYLDEIIIVYNDCSDATPEIAERFAAEFPEKIKVYHYVPNVYPALSKKHVITSPFSIHSLVNYYNFALSKTTKKVVVKIDADHLPVITKFSAAVERIRKEGLDTMQYFYGVNVYVENEAILVNKKKPFTHGFDCGFFPVGKGTYFIHRKNSESLKLPLRMYFTRVSLGVLFYHLKGLKLNAFSNVEDLFLQEAKRMREDVLYPDLLPWKKAREQFRDMLDDIPEPTAVISLSQYST